MVGDAAAAPATERSAAQASQAAVPFHPVNGQAQVPVFGPGSCHISDAFADVLSAYQLGEPLTRRASQTPFDCSRHQIFSKRKSEHRHHGKYEK